MKEKPSRIHEEVSPKIIARIALREIGKDSEVKGTQGTLLQWLRRRPGIKVRLDKEDHISIEASIVVHYGANVREVALRVQAAIGEAIRRISDCPLKEIRIVIAATAP